MLDATDPIMGNFSSWCWNHPLGPLDWNPCFRIGVLNTFIPLALIAGQCGDLACFEHAGYESGAS